MNEHTPSMPLGTERGDMGNIQSVIKRCKSCGSILDNQNIRDYYTCQECGWVSTEFATE